MKRMIVLVLLAAVLLAGCDQAGLEPAATETPAPEPTLTRGKVAAEATLEPARWSELRFERAGVIAEVLVREGQGVEDGAVLARLDTAEAELAVQEARFALEAAEASLALLLLGPHPAELEGARADLEDAEGALARAVAQRDELTGGAAEADIAGAQADVAAAEADWLVARDDRDELYRRTDEHNEDDREQREQADYVFHAAREALTAAQAALEAERGAAPDRVRGAEAKVAAALAQRDVVSATLALLEGGSADWEIDAAQADVAQAAVALRQAEAALDPLILRAPFAGTVAGLDIELGSRVEPGQTVATLAKTDQLEAHTVDLTELDVARIRVGQPVEISPDALPDVQLSGRVARIGLRSVEYLGDVTYPVVIELEDRVPGLRWGMTALVEIAVD